jgi:hypothetical protein
MHYADFFDQHLHLLANLGWKPDPWSPPPAAKRALTRLGFEVREIHRLRTQGGCLAILRLGAHQLPEVSSVVSAFVETTWETLGLLRWCQKTLEADAALLIDPTIAWLYRIDEGDHCLVCPDGQAVEDRLLPIFAGESDPVAAILAWQRESTEAKGRGLRQWLQLWERRLGEACGLATTDARRLVEQLVLVRKCRDLAWVRQVPTLERALDRPLELLIREEVEGALSQSLRTVDLLDRELSMPFCLRASSERQHVEEALARSELAGGALLRSIELLSRDHLSARVWLAAEAEPELQRTSWRLIVEDPHPMAAHGATATPHTAPRMRLDVIEVGYERILHVVGEALRWIVDHNASLEREYAGTSRTAFQPDFLTLADGGADDSGFITDPIHFALRHLTEVIATLPPQNRLLKWLLTLDLLERIETMGLVIERMPNLDRYC